MQISEIKSAWRSKWAQAKFRDAIFYVETDQRQGGRRVALHQYPKRNQPYAEDMGRSAIQITVQGYVIGRQQSQSERGPSIPAQDYLTMKNALITALELDGPGWLCLPMQYQFRDLEVMVMNYGVTEARERGGMAVFNMQFCEYGTAKNRTTISTPDEVNKQAFVLNQTLMGKAEGKALQEKQAAMAPYTKVYESASS